MASMDSTSSCKHTSSICSAIEIARHFGLRERERKPLGALSSPVLFHFTLLYGVPGPYGNILAFKTISQFLPEAAAANLRLYG